MNVLVASGGTVAPIDAVRHIANASTGNLGAAIVEAALARGADVWHLRTPSALRPFDRSARFDLDAPDPQAEFARLLALRLEYLAHRPRLHPVPLATGTVPEYAETLARNLQDHPIDLAFLPIAAADFAPEPAPGKLDSRLETLTIRCHRLPKIIAQVRAWSPATYLVGFKLLANVPHAELIRQGLAACLANRADLTVANDLATVAAGRHTVHLIRPDHPAEALGPDPSIAAGLVDRAFEWATILRG